MITLRHSAFHYFVYFVVAGWYLAAPIFWKSDQEDYSKILVFSFVISIIISVLILKNISFRRAINLSLFSLVFVAFEVHFWGAIVSTGDLMETTMGKMVFSIVLWAIACSGLWIGHLLVWIWSLKSKIGI